MRKAFVISRFAAKLFPLPGVPKIKPLGFLSRGTFLGAGKSYMIKGKQAEKKAENALCRRLKRLFGAGNIKPLPTSEKRLRQG